MTSPFAYWNVSVRLVEVSNEDTVLARHFGTLSTRITRSVHMHASRLCPSTRVDCMKWRYYEFSGDGLYMAPEVEAILVEDDRDGFRCTLSSHAFGIAASLLAYIGFAGVGGGCVEQHSSSLLELAPKHAEAELIRQVVAGGLI